ncbi:hypothetical protein ACHQM5_029677 [Ranunculus cassubicifolius]
MASSSSSRTRNIPFASMNRCDTIEEWEDCFDMLSNAPTDYRQLLLYSFSQLGLHNKKNEVREKKSVKEAKEDQNALYLKVEMPEVIEKENIQITVKNATVVITGNLSTPDGEREEDKSGLKVCKGKLFLRPARIYKVNQIKAEFKNGVLSIVIPKDVKNKTEMNKDELITVKVA